MQYPTLPIELINTWEGNPRTITKEDFDALVNSLLSFPQMLFMLRPLVLDEENKTRGGNMRIQALKHIATLSAMQINLQLEQMPSFKTKSEDVQALMEGEYADLWLTDPPYNVGYVGKTKDALTIQNDIMSGNNFLQFLTDAFTASEAVMKAGAAFYVWFATREHLNFETALNNVGLHVRQELIWNKNTIVLSRQDYHWKHEPCQPAGTMVLTTEGEKPIETLKDGDHVVTYDKSSGQIVGYRNGGFEIKTASRDYDGNMYYISADGKTTRATDNHQFSVRFNAEAKNNYVTYLMKRGNWWRVGVAKAYDARQFGMKSRYHGEKAEAMWAITTHKTREEAQIMEHVLTCKYGIPYTVWETGAMCRRMVRTDEGVAEIYAKLDLDKMAKDAHRLLEDHGRKYEFPLICEENKRGKFSCRVSVKIHACNLLPEIMQLPIPTKGGEFIWASITSAKYKHEKCKVYSLAVDKHQHYIADGIVTHNCLYGWKEGEAHYFTPSRQEATVIADAQEYDFAKMKKGEMRELLESIFADTTPTSVINEKKPARSEDHPTMKPVRLFGYQIANSSKKGDIVLDTFGGSGTTIIACEQLGRKARVMELDQHYCDVIIARWEKLTGCMAVKINEQTNENEE